MFKQEALAVQYGAIEITWRQAGAMNSHRRVTGELGKPEDAEELYGRTKKI